MSRVGSEVSSAIYAPVRFGSEAFLRIGSLMNKLKDYPANEAALWASFSKNPFETGIAKTDLGGDEVLALLDFSVCFDLLKNGNGVIRLRKKVTPWPLKRRWPTSVRNCHTTNPSDKRSARKSVCTRKRRFENWSPTL